MPLVKSKLVRIAILCLAWALPVLGGWLGLRLAPAQPDAGVNMFGLTPGQHQFMLMGFFVGVVAMLALTYLTGQGVKWLLPAFGVAVLVFIAAAVLSNLFPLETLVPGTRTVLAIGLSLSFFGLPPVSGALLIAAPEKADEAAKSAGAGSPEPTS